MPVYRVNDILQIFNELFFLGAVDFDFACKDFSLCGALGQCLEDGSIEMNSRLDDLLPADRRLSLLGTLSHELTHAFFYQFACDTCPTYAINVDNASGHGRAFRMVIATIEEAFPWLFTDTIDIGSFNDI